MDALEALFSSRVRVSLLKALLEDPMREFYGRELARRAGERQSAVWRELQNLESIGLVERRESGAVTHFGVRSGFPLLQELRLLFARAEGWAVGQVSKSANESRSLYRPPVQPSMVIGEED